MNPTLKVSEDLNRDSGYAVITIAGLDTNIERLSFSIMRHGYDVNYIGQSGWQAAFEWLEPEDAWYDNGQLKFVIPPDTTWQMDPQGYVLKLNIAPSGGELEIEFFWPDVLPAEIGTTPDLSDRLTGTKVKPSVEKPDKKEPVPPEPEAAAPPFKPPRDEVTQEPTSAPIKPYDKPVQKAGIGAGTIAGIIIASCLIAGLAYWLLKGDMNSASTTGPAPSTTGSPISTSEPAGSSVDSTSETSSPGAGSQAVVPEPRTTPIKTVNEPSKSALTLSDSESPVAVPVEKQSSTASLLSETVSEPQENRSYQSEEVRSERIVEPKSLSTSSNTRNALLEALDGSDESRKPTTEDLLKPIEPALREKTGE